MAVPVHVAHANPTRFVRARPEPDALVAKEHEVLLAIAIGERKLERAIAGATATARGADCATGGAFTLLRPSGRLPLRVLVSPLARESVIAPNPNAFAIVLVSDDTGSRCVSPDALEGLYGLTPAEAALAALLVEGLTLQQAAAARGVVVETARSHLKRIFAKTGTTRQSELVRLLLLGPAAFGH